MADGWIEPRTKIPFTGIVAMVIIVAIVAIFIKTQLAPLFPQSEITVMEGDQNLAGRASASFYGMREIPLSKKAYLQGVMNTPRTSMTFTIDVSGKLLTISHAGKREEVQLTDAEGTLNAVFEYDGIQTQVSIDPLARVLKLGEPGKSVGFTDIGLSEVIVYQGLFTLRSEQYLFQFSAAGPQAIITGARTDRVALVQNDAIYSGVWRAAKSHPISVDTDRRIATIEELY